MLVSFLFSILNFKNMCYINIGGFMEKLNYKIVRDGNFNVTRIMFSRDDFKHYLEVCFVGNLNLYFTLVGLDEGNTFLIGKDNYEIYEIFDSLYKEILNGGNLEITEEENNFLKMECSMYEKGYHLELAEMEKRREKTRQLNLRIASVMSLIKDDKVIWRSDDFPAENAPFFIIHKLSNAYELEFGESTSTKKLDDFQEFPLHDAANESWISVRLRNSGSRYEPFNTCFMHAYNKMLELDPKYHQIGIEEFMIDEKVKNGEILERILKK